MQKIIKWLIKIFLSEYELITKNAIVSFRVRIERLNNEDNRLRTRIGNQSDVIRHLEQIVEQHNLPQVGRGIVDQVQEQGRIERNPSNNDGIYKNFSSRMNTIRAIKSPTKNCQWISIYNSQSLLYIENSLGIIEEFTKYGNKKMVLVDVQESKLKDIKKVFKKSHDINFEKPYKNSNGSSMVIIMFKLNKKYYKKWLQPDSSWMNWGNMGGIVYNQFSQEELQNHLNTLSSHYLRDQSVKKEPVKPRPLSWKEQTRGLKYENIYKKSNKYDKKVNETQNNYDIRMRKLKQEEHKNRMINGYTQTMINSPHIIHPNNF